MFSRNHEKVLNEYELHDAAKELFQKKKYNFVLVSSTNLDSIMSFYHAVPDDKEFICDAYQYIQMDTAHKNFGEYYGGGYKRYNKAIRCKELRHTYIIEKKDFDSDKDLIMKNGFVMLLRATDKFTRYLEQVPKEESQIIYSMWEGYRQENKPYTNAKIIELLEGYEVESLHTSGHASVSCIRNLIERTKPSVIIPMHSDCPEKMVHIKEFEEYRDNIDKRSDGDVFRIS